MEQKQGDRNSRTVRVSGRCYRQVSLSARKLSRSRSWIVEQAVAEYAKVQGIGKRAPRLEVRA